MRTILKTLPLTQTIALDFEDAPNAEWGPYTPEVSLFKDGIVPLTASAAIRPEALGELQAMFPRFDKTRGCPLGALSSPCSPGELDGRTEIALADYRGKGQGLPGLVPQLVAGLAEPPHRHLTRGGHQIPVCRFAGPLKAVVDALFAGQNQTAD